MSLLDSYQPRLIWPGDDGRPNATPTVAEESKSRAAETWTCCDGSARSQVCAKGARVKRVSARLAHRAFTAQTVRLCTSTKLACRAPRPEPLRAYPTTGDVPAVLPEPPVKRRRRYLPGRSALMFSLGLAAQSHGRTSEPPTCQCGNSQRRTCSRSLQAKERVW